MPSLVSNTLFRRSCEVSSINANSPFQDAAVAFKNRVTAPPSSLLFLVLTIVMIFLGSCLLAYFSYLLVRRSRTKKQEPGFVLRPFLLRTNALECRVLDVEKGAGVNREAIVKSRRAPPFLRFGTGAVTVTESALSGSQDTGDFSPMLFKHEKNPFSNKEDVDDHLDNQQQLPPILTSNGNVASLKLDRVIKTVSTPRARWVVEALDLPIRAQSAVVYPADYLGCGGPNSKDSSMFHDSTVILKSPREEEYDDERSEESSLLDSATYCSGDDTEETTLSSLDNGAHESSSFSSLPSSYSAFNISKSLMENSERPVSPFDDKLIVAKRFGGEVSAVLSDRNRDEEPSSLGSLSSSFHSDHLYELDCTITAFKESKLRNSATDPSRGRLRVPCCSAEMKEAARITLFRRRLELQRDPDVGVLILNPVLRDRRTLRGATAPEYYHLGEPMNPENVRKEARFKAKRHAYGGRGALPVTSSPLASSELQRTSLALAKKPPDLQPIPIPIPDADPFLSSRLLASPRVSDSGPLQQVDTQVHDATRVDAVSTSAFNRISRSKVSQARETLACPENRPSSRACIQLLTLSQKPKDEGSSPYIPSSNNRRTRILLATSSHDSAKHPYISNPSRNLSIVRDKDPKPSVSCPRSRPLLPPATNRQGASKAASDLQYTKVDTAHQSSSLLLTRKSRITRGPPVVGRTDRATLKLPTTASITVDKVNLQESTNDVINKNSILLERSAVASHAKRRRNLSDISGFSRDIASSKRSKLEISAHINRTAMSISTCMTSPKSSRQPPLSLESRRKPADLRDCSIVSRASSISSSSIVL